MARHSVLLLAAYILTFVALAGCDSNETPASGGQAPDAQEPDPVFSEGTYPMEVSNQDGAPIYQESSNELTVNIPLISADSLILKAEGQEAQGPTITILPAGDDVVIEAYALQPDGSERFLRQKTIRTQPPRGISAVRVLDQSGRELTSGDNVSLSRPTLDFLIDPDSQFAQSHPTDARYRISRARVAIRSGLQSTTELGTFDLQNGSTLNLSRELGSATQGDQLIIELQGILRINSAVEAIPVLRPVSERTFAFILS